MHEASPLPPAPPSKLAVVVSSVLFLGLPCGASPQEGPEEAGSGIRSDVMDMPSGERFLRHELLIGAPLDEVWAAFTTEEELKTWYAPVVSADFRVGGQVQSNYSPDAEIGDPGTISVSYVNYVPRRILTMQGSVSEEYPPELRAAGAGLYTLLEFEEADSTSTRVVSWGIGYRTGGIWDEYLDYFVHDAEWTYSMLIKRFRDGPIDWSKIEP